MHSVRMSICTAVIVILESAGRLSVSSTQWV